jgi:hypothetical protein
MFNVDKRKINVYYNTENRSLIMTILLKEAFNKASELPEPLQDEIAKELLEDIEAEFLWDQTLKDTEDKLAMMAEKALKDFKTGKTKKMGFDQL